MNIYDWIDALACHAMNTGLAEPEDFTCLVNRLLEAMGLSDYAPTGEAVTENLEEILAALLDDACARGLCQDSVTARDLFDTRLMGLLTPPPREVRARFQAEYEKSPQAATDWFYRFCQDTDYIRAYRIEKDMRWKFASEYGDLDITINLSKPEKDPKAIAAAGAGPQSGYPKCQLCAENEGYAGRLDHPARQNHRIIPVTLDGGQWYFQYSPYVYYNEHCIVFNRDHVPMVIDKSAFRKLLDFTARMPHYFVGSNADLPIVGGSILSHEHFQGGRYVFPMAVAAISSPLTFRGYPDIAAGILKWPMSVIRLTGKDPARLTDLADRILTCWRGWSDPACFLFAETEGVPHSTITPIARRQGTDYQLDLVLRNNITTAEHPLGVFHPHGDKHHIKKENIGLIEVMGTAVLPARLKRELSALRDAILSGQDLRRDETLAKHADWAEALAAKYEFTEDNAMDILLRETGRVFEEVLEDCAVYPDTPEGRAGFARFVAGVNAMPPD